MLIIDDAEAVLSSGAGGAGSNSIADNKAETRGRDGDDKAEAERRAHAATKNKLFIDGCTIKQHVKHSVSTFHRLLSDSIRLYSSQQNVDFVVINVEDFLVVKAESSMVENVHSAYRSETNLHLCGQHHSIRL